MSDIFFLSAAAGVLGEAALLRGFARLFPRENETYELVVPEEFKELTTSPTGNPTWRFVFVDDIADRPLESNAAAVLLVAPTVQGALWAQRQKNKLLLKGMSTARMVGVVLFAREESALPVQVIEGTLGLTTEAIDCSLSRLFWAHNDESQRGAALLEGLKKTVNAIRERFDRVLSSTSAADIPWRAIEKEVLQSLWTSGSASTSVSALSHDEVAERVRAHTAICLARRKLGSVDASLLRQLERRLIDHATGLGPLEPLLRDPDVNEIMIVGTASLFVEKQGRITRMPPAFDHEAHLKTLIERIVAPSGRRVDWAAPFCDVRLKDGSRVNIVLPPLALDGPCVTIRRFRPGFSSMENLRGAGSVDDDQAKRLERAVAERRNIIIAGNTGAGKTTLMNVLASLIPDDERILTLEDAAELVIPKSHVVRMETRSANTEGKGQITMRDLVVNALRMRPDRLLVGECRGEEVIPMLQAMNTGHDGSMTTLHSNSADEVSSRLESLVSMSAPSWSLDLVRQQIRSAFDVIVYMKREGGRRRVMEIRDVV